MLLDYKKITAIGTRSEEVAELLRGLEIGLQIEAKERPEPRRDGGTLYVMAQEDFNDEWNAYCVHEFISPLLIDPTDREGTRGLLSQCL